MCMAEDTRKGRNEGDSNFSVGKNVRAAESGPESNFDWRLAAREALLFTGIMHTINITTEAGTRDAINGPWLRGIGKLVWVTSETILKLGSA